MRDHAALTGPICFGLAFAESLAVLSLFVPSTLILVGIGTLIRLADLSFWEMWIGASLGAAAGDWVSYAIGSRYGARLVGLWPLSRHPALLARGEDFFRRWGGLGLFAGRFLGPLRATVPLVAGSCAMPMLPFQVANLTSAMAWSFLVLAPGLFGTQWLPGWIG